MKTKLLSVIVLLLLMSTQIFAQQYPEVSIYDIQYQDPASLLTNGDQQSPYEGDTVTITGVTMNPVHIDNDPSNDLTLRAGSVPAFYIQDTSDTEYSGILARFPDPNATISLLDSGTVVNVTGVVTEYFVTTQFDLIDFEGSDVIGFKERPEPIVIPLDSLSQIGTREGNILAERWEGMLVEVRNVTVTEPGAIGSGTFVVFDNNNTQVVIGNGATYYYNATPPQAGTVLEYVRGYIQNRTNSGGQQNLFIIMPVYPEDVQISEVPPTISNITRNPDIVNYGQQVTVSAQIEDPDGTVADAKLLYRVNSGTRQEVTMTNSGGNSYVATIPAQNDSAVVDFFIRSEDNQGNVSTNPSDTVQGMYFYLVLDRPLTIQDVQFSPFGSGFSGYDGYNVTVRGIVVADTTDIEGDGNNTGPQVILQNGSGPWSAIRLRGTAILDRRRGDDISVTGTVDELFSQTLIDDIDDAGQITIHSTGNTLPDPVHVSTQTIDRLSSGSVQAEQWESVLIQYRNITVTDENADGNPGPGGGGNSNFGEMLVADSTGIETRIELQDGTHSYNNFWDPSHENDPFRIKQNDQFDYMTGILFYSFGNYKLIPRKDDDFGPNTVSVNEDGLTPYEYALAQNYPNPFNPSTKINYSLADAGNVTIKIFNILGQEIVTLVDGFKEAGKHSVSFDASSLSSGIYLYKINAANFTSTKKMILLR